MSLNLSRQIFGPLGVGAIFTGVSISSFYLARLTCSVVHRKHYSNYSKMPSVNESLVLKYTKVVPEAYAPTKGSLKAAGYDLKSAFDITVPARGKALVDTGLKIQLPEGCYGRIAPRSGLAVKNFIDVGGKNFCILIGIGMARNDLKGGKGFNEFKNVSY